jgi:curved DNA-binding protein CbpA
MADLRALLENHYDVLGVSQTASVDEITVAENAIRKVYEELAHKGDATANDVLRRLNEARAALAVDYKRAEYDRAPASLRDAFADVAYSPQIGRFEKLGEVGEWLGGGDSLRAATLLDAPLPSDLLVREPLLDDER